MMSAIDVKKFIFRCCGGDVDEDDIKSLTGTVPDFYTNPNCQWYSVETEEHGDEMLAVSKTEVVSNTDDCSKILSVSNMSFAAESLLIRSVGSMSLPLFFVKQLCNIGVQMKCETVNIKLSQYLDPVVDSLETMGFRESGGHYSEDTNTMIHEFSLDLIKDEQANVGKSSHMIDVKKGEEDNVVLAFLAGINLSASSFEVIGGGEAETSAPPQEMKSLIDDLFRALHNENP